MNKTTKIRWVIAHEPLHLFLRAAKDFEKRVNELQKENLIQVEIMTMTEYSDRYNNGVEVSKHDLLELMNQGKLEMTQIYTTWLAENFEKDMYVLTLPYLFDSHEHAARVFEGEVGQHLLDRVTEKSNNKVKALSYTYCGGYFQLTSDLPVTKLDDMIGRKYRSNRSPVQQATLKALGIEPYVCELEDMVDEVNAGNCHGGETAYPRMYPLGQNEVLSTVVNTEHTLFLTSMICSNDFWNELSPEVQDIIKEAAKLAGRDERREAVDEAVDARARLINDGKAIYELTPEERVEAKRKTSVVYDQFREELDFDLVDKIIKAR
jgi:TRAP-type C4-dicarboxylate transport system substrate-binding protein